MWKTLGLIANAARQGFTSGRSYIGAIVEQHKGIRRFIVLWSVALTTWVTIKVFTTPFRQISGNVVAAFSAVTALVGLAVSLYQTSRSREDRIRKDHYNDGDSIPGQ